MVKNGRTRALALGRALACVASLVCSCSRAVPESSVAPRANSAPARSASAQPIIASTVAPLPHAVTSDPPVPVAVSPEVRAARDYAQRRLLRADDPLMPDL